MQFTRDRTSLAHRSLIGLIDVGELIELSKQGYVKGILKKLDELMIEEPQQAAFILSLRSLMENFKLHDFNRRLQEIAHE